MITSNTGNFANILNEINIDVDLWAQDDREQENDSSRYFLFSSRKVICN